MNHTPKNCSKILLGVVYPLIFIYFLKVNSKRCSRRPLRISLLFFHLCFSLGSLCQLPLNLSLEDTISHASWLALLNSDHLSLKLCQLGVLLFNNSFLLLFKKALFLAYREKRSFYAKHILIYRRVVRLLLSLLHRSFLRCSESFFLRLGLRFWVDYKLLLHS